MTAALRQALEQSLAERPDDLATHMAYADHLAETGDPRGEFIRAQLALEDRALPPEDRRRLRRREKELLLLHLREWLGEDFDLLVAGNEKFWRTAMPESIGAVEDDYYDGKDEQERRYGPPTRSDVEGPTYGLPFHFARGWLDAVWLNGKAEQAEALGRCPLSRLVRRLHVSSGDPSLFETLARQPFLDCVRLFMIGNDYGDGCHARGAGAEAAVARMKRVEELYFYAHGVNTRAMFALAMPNLRSLHVHHVTEYPLEVLAANPTLGNLSTLHCWPHAVLPGEEACVRLDNFVALARSPHLKNLSRLALYLSSIGDAGVQAPFFFARHLKDNGGKPPEALMFQTGSNKWVSHERWPPMDVTTRKLYFHPDGKLAFKAPEESATPFDEYVSDPAKPVPYRPRPVTPTYPGREWQVWMVEDQRFTQHRPDVLTYETEPLGEDLTVAGSLTAHLFGATSGTDCDWVVRLIDVYPEKMAKTPDMGGYQLLVSGEVIRARFRKSFKKPEAVVPGEVNEHTIDLHWSHHCFRKGHKILVQVQSTWFPLIDRNPQKFVPNIYKAKDSDFQSARQRVYRSPKYPSAIRMQVVGEVTLKGLCIDPEYNAPCLGQPGVAQRWRVPE